MFFLSLSMKSEELSKKMALNGNKLNLNSLLVIT